MITEEKKLEAENKTRQEAISEAKEIMKCAARYERLAVNKDFLDMLEDLKKLKKVHEDEVKGWTEQLEGMSFFKTMRLVEVIKVNQIRANQLTEALAYIPKLLHMADEARMWLRANTQGDQSNG